MQDHDPLAYLEPEQLLSDRSRPLPRAQLSRRANAGLWALRLFALGLSAMVIYTFIAQLGS
jgi:hypothetical protein